MQEEEVNEFAEQEKKNQQTIADNRREQLRERLYGDKDKDPMKSTQTKETLSRIEDIENSSVQVGEALAPLSSSDDLEAVKGRLNKIIEILNKTVV